MQTYYIASKLAGRGGFTVKCTLAMAIDTARKQCNPIDDIWVIFSEDNERIAEVAKNQIRWLNSRYGHKIHQFLFIEISGVV